MKKDIAAIDIAKLLCALLVVGIHTQPLGGRLDGGGIFLPHFVELRCLSFS
jgi:hypothetical protein